MSKKYLNYHSDPYATHIPALQFIFENHGKEIDFAVELGMGHFSTGFLLDHVTQSVVSMEMQEKAWYDKMVEELQVPKRQGAEWHPVLALGADTFHKVSTEGIVFALVDGHGSTRPEAVNYFMLNGVPTIVAHDTDSGWYGWERIIRNDYFVYHFTELLPYTSVWTKDESLIKALQARS